MSIHPKSSASKEEAKKNRSSPFPTFLARSLQLDVRAVSFSANTPLPTLLSLLLFQSSHSSDSLFWLEVRERKSKEDEPSHNFLLYLTLACCISSQQRRYGPSIVGSRQKSTRDLLPCPPITSCTSPRPLDQFTGPKGLVTGRLLLCYRDQRQRRQTAVGHLITIRRKPQLHRTARDKLGPLCSRRRGVRETLERTVHSIQLRCLSPGLSLNQAVIQRS